MTHLILIVEDDPTFRGLLKTILEDEGYETRETVRAEDALKLMAKERYDLVVSDLRLPGMSGLEMYRASRDLPSPPPFIMLTAYGAVDEAVAAIKEGVLDFLTKPLKDPDTLRRAVKKALDATRREREYLALKETEKAGLPPEELIFAGAAMEPVRRAVVEVAPTNSTVIIEGESGTGKELVARVIHLHSHRRGDGFVAVNCAAIPENLLESELFGHEQGAFTGAVKTRRGKFELAQGGTLFLDEVSELPRPLQAKLLRVLQERRFERVGGEQEIRADVRIVAATNRDIEAEVREGRFREDLFYRLNVFPVVLPPLRDRKDAIAALAEYFVRRFAGLMAKQVKGIGEMALAQLTHYGWPGNIRELQNVIERSVILASGEVRAFDLPSAAAGNGMAKQPEHTLGELERAAIMDALKSCGNNRRLAAERLGISRRTLQYRLRRYGLVDEDKEVQ